MGVALADARLTWGNGVDPEEARVVVARVEGCVGVANLPRRHGQRLPQGRNDVGAWATKKKTDTNTHVRNKREE